jgi:hypothetical protein
MGTSVVLAQKVTGTVLDAETREPIQFVNVYFANTTIGTTTDSQGLFVLDGFLPGKYELTVSFVGYTSYSMTLEVVRDNTLEVAVLLKQEIINLPEIYVKADNTHWENDFAFFRRHFLGIHPSARENVIQNPKTLVFYYDQDEKVLYAHAREPIVVKNEYLGYTHTFDMKSFTLNTAEGKLIYYGIPRFENLTPKNRREENQWQRNRRKSYEGSLLHFLRSLDSDSLKENEFEVQEVIVYPNPERLPEAFLEEKITHFRNEMKELSQSGQKRPMVLGDSLRYYLNEAKRPRFLERPGRVFTSRNELLEGSTITFTGKLLIKYTGSREHMEYPTPYSPYGVSFQHSYLTILEPIQLYDNGYYEPVTSLLITGYWSWSNTASSTLPLDYYPAKE